ncbi:MAG: HNH endonuclease [Patescibacteria group bacterium]|nr:HNH endonuclease [Patescibacteria group bacterium]
MSEKIFLTGGRYTLVDEVDFERFDRFCWGVSKSKCGDFYVRRNIGHFSLLLHREIMDAPKGLDVDHINGDTLDNRRANLRIVTRSENLRNRHRRQKPKSGYYGVRKMWNKWEGRIRGENGKMVRLGAYFTAVEAAQAVDEALRKRDGKFARLNFADNF